MKNFKHRKCLAAPKVYLKVVWLGVPEYKNSQVQTLAFAFLYRVQEWRNGNMKNVKDLTLRVWQSGGNESGLMSFTLPS